MNVLIIGANGFIGSHLSYAILDQTDWCVFAIDINSHYLNELRDHPRFTFIEGDISINQEWIENHIKECDVVLPLVAIAQPKIYVERPIDVFTLDFEENLKIIRWVHKYNRRLIFPSSSEVYGMSEDQKFSEDNSNFVYGPIHKTRWIYASSKQLLDRLIYAYGRDEGLNYTVFRPFNWIGPRLDSLEIARVGNSRVLTQFICNLIDGEDLLLVGGGVQKRTFTDISDGIEALMNILQNESNSRSKIFNIGNPDNVISIKELAHLTRNSFSKIAGVPIHNLPQIRSVKEEDYYGMGKGFQDIDLRVPSIKIAMKTLNWKPSIDLKQGIDSAIESFLKDDHSGRTKLKKK